MKHIYLNLKRFDIPAEDGGVNRLAPAGEWGACIVKGIQQELKSYGADEAEFAVYFPEAHILTAAAALDQESPVRIGCQSVYRDDVSQGGNFGAFTANRTAKAMRALGCCSALIGHCEERKDQAGILAEAGVKDTAAVNRLLNKEIQAAVAAGLKVLYCIGEAAEEQSRWREVLKEQLTLGLDGVDKSQVVIAYEPVWAIGPGKTPPDQDYIAMIASYVKEVTNGMDVVYGGGLKSDNAKMLASIPEIDGGLIALTRFSGDIGFYPKEYLEIIRMYMRGGRQTRSVS